MIVTASPQVRLPRIDLAAAPDFMLGGVQVRPSRRQVCAPGKDGRELEPRVMKVLVALATARGAVVSRDHLVDACWDGRIVGDDSLNRCVVALRRLARDIDPQPFAIETVPRIGYFLMETQLPVAPSGEREAGKARSPSFGEADHVVLPASGPVGRHWLIVAVAFVAVLIAAGLFIQSRPAVASDSPPRVQLMGFSSLSPELPPSVADAFRDELENAVSTDRALMVVDTDESAAAGRALLQLSGAVRRVGADRRYTLRLRNPASGATIWSQVFDRPSERPEAAREVAIKVSGQLRCGLAPMGERARMTDAQRALWFKFCAAPRSEEGGTSDAVLDAAREVTAAMPGFGPGWSARALWSVPLDPRPGDEAALMRESVDAADRALKLDADDSWAWFARALQMIRSGDHAEVERRYLKALAPGPTDSGLIHGNYGVLLQRLGRLEDAKEQFQRAYDLSPTTPQAADGWATILLYLRHDGEGLRLLDRNLALWPDHGDVLSTAVRTAFWTGKHDRALAALANDRWTMHPHSREALMVAIRAQRSGRPEERSRAAALLKAAAASPATNRTQIPSALAALGEDRAAVAAARGLDQETHALLFSPSFARARHLPEFAALAERHGYMRYWREAGRHPDFCRAADAPGLCRRL